MANSLQIRPVLQPHPDDCPRETHQDHAHFRMEFEYRYDPYRATLDRLVANALKE